MDTVIQDTMLFFDKHETAYPLYEQFQEKLLAHFPEKSNQGAKIPNLILQQTFVCLCVLLEGKKEIRTTRRLFCTDAGAVCSIGLKLGSGKN